MSYIDENLHRLPATGHYTTGAIRSLDRYTHSREHRRLARLRWRAEGDGDKSKRPTLEELEAAYRAELAMTVGTRYEVWTHTTMASAVAVLSVQGNIEAKPLPYWIQAIRAGSQGNVPAEAVIDMQEAGYEDPLAEAGL